MAKNIYNPTTGERAYQVPGAALPSGFQSVGPTGANLYNSQTNTYGYQVPGGPVPTGYQTLTQSNIYPNGVSPTINSSSLAPASPINVPSTTPDTTAASVIASSQQNQANAEKAAADSLKAEQQAAGVGQAQALKDQALGKVRGLYDQAASAYSTIDSSPEKQQLLTEQKTLSDLNTQIADENVKLRGAQDAIKSRGDISSTAQQGLLDNLNDTYGRRLADLAIRQSAASGNVTRLQSALKDALDLKLAPINKELEYYDKFANAYYNDLDASEQKTLDRLIAEKKTQADKITSDQNIANTALKTASESGVKIPDNIVQQILQNPSQAYSILASNGISLVNPIDQAYKQAQTAKLYADINSNGSSVNIKRTDANGNPLPPTATDTALQVILGSAKFTKDQKATVVNAINNGEDPFTVIKNQAKNIMGQTEATTLTKYETARDTLADIGDELSQFYAAGGKTSLISGTFEKVLNNLGQVNDPKLVGLATQIQGNLQVYRNAVSGTAYSAQEGKDIASIFPGINKSADLNKAILSARSTLFDSVIDATYRSALGSSYDDLRKAEAASQPVDPAVAKKTVNDFIASNPMQLPTIEQLYSVPNTTDADVVEYLKLKGLIK